MQAKKVLTLGSILLTFSGSVVAGVPNESIISRNVDIGTLTSTPFETVFSFPTNFIHHSYTFDLDVPATVEARILNADLQSGYVWDIQTNYDVKLVDSRNQVLYQGTTRSYPNLSTIEAVVTGELPAGKDYYVEVHGGQILAAGLSYDAKISAFPSVVPEPETYAMFLAGLGLMGFMARRNQTKTK